MPVQVVFCNISQCQILSTVYGLSKKKSSVFEKILLTEYQINNVDVSRVSLLTYSIRFSNLPGLNQSLLLVEIGDFL